MDPPTDVLEDIMFKFVCNLSAEDLGNHVQLMFQIERAWWYYEDTIRVERPHLRRFANYGTFTNMLAEKVVLLKSLLGDTQTALKEYAAYKVRIPVYGAILMDQNMERVLLVRGHASSSGWGFPKGKINHGEAEIDCACREVLEETGCNIEELINPGAYIEAKGQNDKIHKLFIVVGVDPETTAFAPHLPGEIGAYGWHWLHELPMTRDDADKAYIASGGKQHRFYMVQPFVSRLRNWVSKQRRALGLAPPRWEVAGGTTATSTGSKAQSQTSTSRQAAQALKAASDALAPSPATSSKPQSSGQAMGGWASVGSVTGMPIQNRQPDYIQIPAVAPQVAAPPPAVPTGNLVLSSEFRFDLEPILRALVA